jgi:hypothetical protein
MMILTLTALWVLSSIWGFFEDIKFIKQNPHFKEFHIGRIMADIFEEDQTP